MAASNDVPFDEESGCVDACTCSNFWDRQTENYETIKGYGFRLQHLIQRSATYFHFHTASRASQIDFGNYCCFPAAAAVLDVDDDST
jgi:hypothetical protein